MLTKVQDLKYKMYMDMFYIVNVEEFVYIGENVLCSLSISCSSNLFLYICIYKF